MNPTLTIPWSVPITDYWLFYLVFGIIGFVLCFYSRFFITFVVPLLLWFCIADLRSFYHQDLGSKQLGPSNDYVFGVAVSMLITLGLSGLGTYLNWKNNRFGTKTHQRHRRF